MVLPLLPRTTIQNIFSYGLTPRQSSLYRQLKHVADHHWTGMTAEQVMRKEKQGPKACQGLAALSPSSLDWKIKAALQRFFSVYPHMKKQPHYNFVIRFAGLRTKKPLSRLHPMVGKPSYLGNPYARDQYRARQANARRKSYQNYRNRTRRLDRGA